MRSQRRLMTLLALLTALLLVFTACAKGGDEDTDGVASISDDDSGDADDNGSEGGDRRGSPADEAEFQDAMLEYAQCMRDQGLDFPDPEFSGDGGVMMGGGAATAGDPEASREAFEEADKDCRPILDEVMPDIDMSPEEQAEMQDQYLEVAACMREKGHDMPDPVVGDDGSVRISADDAGAVASGAGEGPKGPPPQEFQDDMRDCEEQAGVTRGPGGDRDEDDGESDGGDA